MKQRVSISKTKALKKYKVKKKKKVQDQTN